MRYEKYYNWEANLGRLMMEIEHSTEIWSHPTDAKKVKLIERMQITQQDDDPNLILYFNETLTEDQELALEEVIWTHSGSTNSDKQFKIYDDLLHIPKMYWEYPPLNDNYSILWYNTTEEHSAWLIAAVNYFRVWDAVNKVGSDQIIREEFTYIKDQDDYVTHYIHDIYWYMNDWTSYNGKSYTKHLTPLESKQLWEEARWRIISDVMINVIGMIVQVDSVTVPVAELTASEFDDLYNVNISQYIVGNKQPLIDAVTNDVAVSRLNDDISWFTPFATIRDYILASI